MQRLLLLLALAGCATRPDDDALLPFGGRGADAGPDAAPMCTAPHLHHQAAVPIESATLVDGAVHHGAAVRVRITFHRTACGVPGPTQVDAALGDQADFLTLTQMVWDRTGEDCVPVPDARTLVLSDLVPTLSGQALVVLDGASHQTLLKVMVAPKPNVPCTPTTAHCQLDCQCPGAARCIPADAGGVCAAPCDEDVDCVPGERCGAGARPSTCGFSSGCQDADCPFGQQCRVVAEIGLACTPAQVNGGEACGCDEQCGFGTICRDDTRLCAAPCRENRDCPGDVVCDNGACDVLP